MAMAREPTQALGTRSYRLAIVVGTTTTATALAVAVVFGAQLVSGTPRPAAAATSSPSPPSAVDVARELAGLINAHSKAIGSAARIGRVSCVQGGPGSYACSYVRVVPPAAGVCAVALLRWTPHTASTYTVGTVGRVALSPGACGPVTKVLHVVGSSG